MWPAIPSAFAVSSTICRATPCAMARPGCRPSSGMMATGCGCDSPTMARDRRRGLLPGAQALHPGQCGAHRWRQRAGAGHRCQDSLPASRHHQVGALRTGACRWRSGYPRTSRWSGWIESRAYREMRPLSVRVGLAHLAVALAIFELLDKQGGDDESQPDGGCRVNGFADQQVEQHQRGKRRDEDEVTDGAVLVAWRRAISQSTKPKPISNSPT